MKEFSYQLRKIMQLRSMSQTDLCEKTGIPKSAISQYLSGAFKPKQERTYLLAQALETTPEYLMGLTDDTEPQVSFEIADIVFNSCKAAGITAESISEAAGISLEEAQNLLTGSGITLPYSKLKKISELIGVTPNDILFQNTCYSFSEKMQKTRLEKGLTLQEFSDRAGYTPDEIIAYETGKFFPDRAFVHNICRAFQVDEEKFVSDVDLMSYENDTYDKLSATEQVLKRQLSGQETELLVAFGKLNPIGRQKAIERVEELYEIERYRRENAT